MNRLLKALFVLAFGAAMTVASAAAQQDKTPSGTAMSKSSAGMHGDAAFVKEAARGGLAEVELGQLAAQKATNDDVKKFGQRMVDDHTKANDQLKQVAEQEHIEVPSQMNAKDKAEKARLEKLSGAQFDKAYMDYMVKDHQADVQHFMAESKSAKSPAVKSFAEQTLPTLRDHLKEAEKLAGSRKVAKAGGTGK